MSTSFESGHADQVHDAQLDYYGRRLATCSSDKTVKVFEIVGDKQSHLADLRGHEGPVWQVCWAHPKFGSLLASCSFDHRVIVWKEAADNLWQQVTLTAQANGFQHWLGRANTMHSGTGLHLSRHPALGIHQQHCMGPPRAWSPSGSSVL